MLFAAIDRGQGLGNPKSQDITPNKPQVEEIKQSVNHNMWRSADSADYDSNQQGIACAASPSRSTVQGL